MNRKREERRNGGGCLIFKIYGMKGEKGGGRNDKMAISFRSLIAES